MDANKQPAADQDDENALEPVDSESLETSADGSQTVDATGGPDGADKKPPKQRAKKSFLKKFNIYLLLFLFILLLGGGFILLGYFQSKSASKTATLKTQTLTQNTLNQVANSDASVGSAQQVLSVQSSAVFAGKVLVRQDLEVAGSLKIGGTVGLTNLAVAGSTQLADTQVSKSLSVSGDTAVQGSVSIAKSLQVNGGANFAGPVSSPQITTSNLQLNSDLTITHHFIAGGGTPSRSSGSALGSGGSASISGSDTAGSVSINTGGGTTAGCFVTVNFTQKYNNTPHVLLTPVGAGGGGLAYYVNRSATNFSICVSNPAPSGGSFGFDYFVVG